MADQELEKSINKVDRDVKWVMGILVLILMGCFGGITMMVNKSIDSFEARVNQRLDDLEARIIRQLDKYDQRLMALDKEVDKNSRQIAVLCDRTKTKPTP